MADGSNGRHSGESRKEWPLWAQLTALVVAPILGVVAILLLLGAIMYNPFTESGLRAIKSLQSDWAGGLERTVTVYDEHGDVLQEWHGTFDLDNNDQEIYFDVEGRRVVIQGGIVIVQEETEEEWQARMAQRNG